MRRKLNRLPNIAYASCEAGEKQLTQKRLTQKIKAMHIALQDTNIGYDKINELYDACLSLDYRPNTFGILSDSLSPTEPFLENSVLFGATKLIKLWLRQLLPSNAVIFYDLRKFDQAYYHGILGDELLNANGKFHAFGKVKHYVPERPMFIKPSNDLKAFSGQVIFPGQHDVEGSLNAVKMIDVDFDDNHTVLINFDLVKIRAEYRVFVVNGKIIDVSQYMLDGQVVPSIVDEQTRWKVINYVQAMQRIYQPHDHYVVDVAITHKGEMKIIEYNCLNCSGMYHIDRSAVFNAILNL